MNTSLKILVLLFLPLCITVLVLGNMLFAKRELLKGRTQKLEQTLIQLGNTIEEASAEASVADYPARDVSPTTAEPLEKPELSKFWAEKYSNSLEKVDLPTVKLSAKENELKAYYKIDPITLTPEKDPISGLYTPGPMNQLLKDVLEKASDQYTRLQSTRQMLTIVREELVDTIKELNQKKGDIRQSFKTIADLKTEIDKLKAEIEQHKTKITELTAEIDPLKAQIEEKDKLVEQTKEEKDTLKRKYDELLVRYKAEGGGVRPKDAAGTAKAPSLKQGAKGKVVAVNSEYNFIIFDLSDEFMDELFSKDEAVPRVVPANVELTVHRPGKQDTFVTKVRLVQIRKEEKKGVADILLDWQQMPVEKGDKIVSY